MMHRGKIVCKHCGSTVIAKDGDLKYAVVQEKNSDTGEPIGKPKTFFMFKCLSCGKGVYLEKFEVPMN
jgi:DNA-directed RNA polymerase subunit RPC12/RpoP